MATTIAMLEGPNIGMAPPMTRLLVPIGASLNYDGSVIYTILNTMYFAQRRNYQMGFLDYVLITLATLFTSFGNPGLAAGHMTPVVLNMHILGLPSDDVTLLAPTDWFMDRFVTVVNVLGDIAGAIIFEEFRKRGQIVVLEKGDSVDNTTAITKKEDSVHATERDQFSLGRLDVTDGTTKEDTVHAVVERGSPVLDVTDVKRKDYTTLTTGKQSPVERLVASAVPSKEGSPPTSTVDQSLVELASSADLTRERNRSPDTGKRAVSR